MRAEYLKEWLAEARKEEAVSAKASEGAEEVIRGPGGGETEGERETDTEKEMTHWEKVVTLAREDFG